MDLIQLFQAGGIAMIPLLCISIINLGLSVGSVVFLYRAISSLNKNTKTPNQFFMEELKSIAELKGSREFKEGKLDELLYRYEVKADWVGNLAGIATLLGLFGTVLGIWEAFSTMKETGEAGIFVFASGISTALITTLYGLLIAIPSVIFYHYLKSGFRKLETQSTLYILKQDGDA